MAQQLSEDIKSMHDALQQLLMRHYLPGRLKLFSLIQIEIIISLARVGPGQTTH